MPRKKTIPPETPKRKPGRPRKVIDEKLLFDLARIDCTLEEMASILNCNRDTLSDNYSAVIQKGKEEGKASIRRMQWKSAQDGNIAMQIWLGKQRLGQREPRDEVAQVELVKVENYMERTRDIGKDFI